MTSVDIIAKSTYGSNAYIPYPVAQNSPVHSMSLSADDAVFLISNFPHLWMYAAGTQTLITMENIGDYFDDYVPPHGGGGGGSGEENVQSDWNQTNTSADDYIKNKPDLVGKKASNGGEAFNGIEPVAYNDGTGNIGDHAHIEGSSNVSAIGQYAHAEGSGTSARGQSSHAEGITTTAGINSLTNNANLGQHAEGNNTFAYAKFSHAEGNESRTGITANPNTGIASHAEGYQTIATGDYSHTEGQKSEASKICAHAEGYNTKASGFYSHAEGYECVASGYYSHAQGQSTTASKDRAVALGLNTLASSATQVALGQNNVEDKNGTYAVIIGNGNTKNSRSDALKIDWSGNIYVGNSDTGVDVSNLPTASFTTVAVGNTNIVADNKADTLSIGGTHGIALNPDASNDSFVIQTLFATENHWINLSDSDVITWTQDETGAEYHSNLITPTKLFQVLGATLAIDPTISHQVPSTLNLRVNISRNSSDNTLQGVILTISDPTLISSNLQIGVMLFGIASSINNAIFD